MKRKCPQCNIELESWTKFKDLQRKEGTGLAVCGFVINGIDHFWSGESRSSKQKADFRTLDLFYCQQCDRYFLRCPNYNTNVILNEMPIETKTVVICSSCRKRLLYASTDYQFGGG